MFFLFVYIVIFYYLSFDVYERILSKQEADAEKLDSGEENHRDGNRVPPEQTNLSDEPDTEDSDPAETEPTSGQPT